MIDLRMSMHLEPSQTFGLFEVTFFSASTIVQGYITDI